MTGFRELTCPIIGDGVKLSFFEMDKEIDFVIKRIYYIYNLEQGQERGFHAHKALKQVLFCPYGSIKVTLDNGSKKQDVILDSPEKLLIIEVCLWREFTALQTQSVLCVGASEVYSEDDYIREYDEFIRWIENESTF